jgi:flagellin
MSATVNTNYGAMVALQALNKTNSDLQQVQMEINTGLKVATAQDNGGVFAIAQAMRGKVAGYGVATNTVDKAISTLDAAITGGNSISDLLITMKTSATAAKDTSLTTAQRAAYNADFVKLRDEITTILSNAEFNGANAIKASPNNIVAFANDSGSSTITVTGVSFSLGGAVITLGASSTIDTATNASNALSLINTSMTNLNKQLATFGSASKALAAHKDFLSKLTDTLNNGIGNLVDADTAADSAKLTALQVKQQLGAQALSIANQAPSILLKFFGG